MLRLLIEDSEGNSKVSPIDLEKQDITIGRKEDNSIRLKDETVSRHHARIFYSPEGLMIEAVAARYGLKINSKKITGPTPVQIGDEIQIGDFRLYIQDEHTDVLKQREEALAEVVNIEPGYQPRLVVVSSNYAGQEYHITKTKVTLGRNPDCDIKMENVSVSGHQAEIHRTVYGDFEIVDLNSSNGTIINGQKITAPVRLSSGDFIMFGHVALRYCAPGDLWSLTFGSYQQPPRNNALIALIVIVAVLAAVVLTFGATSKYLAKKYQNNAANNAVTQDNSGIDGQQIQELRALIKKSNKAMENGNFDEAKASLDEAFRISPDDEDAKEGWDKLEIELASKSALEKVERSLEEKMCRDALDELNNIKPRTWAKDQADAKKLVEEANNCLDAVFLARAMNSIENNDFADAELARDEIVRTNSGSPNIAKINEAIKAKKAHNRGSSDKDNKPVAVTPPPEPVPPPKPQPQEDGDSLESLKAKLKESSKFKERVKLATDILKKAPKDVEANCLIGTNEKASGKTCQAYKRFKIVKDQGADCSTKIDMSWMEANKGTCE